jgi:hypothetical protein
MATKAVAPRIRAHRFVFDHCSIAMVLDLRIRRLSLLRRSSRHRDGDSAMGHLVRVHSQSLWKRHDANDFRGTCDSGTLVLLLKDIGALNDRNHQLQSGQIHSHKWAGIEGVAMKGMRRAIIWTVAASFTLMLAFASSICPPTAHFADIPAALAILLFAIGLVCTLRSFKGASVSGRIGVVVLSCVQVCAIVFIAWLLALALR